MVITKLLQRNIYAFVFDCFLLAPVLGNYMLHEIIAIMTSVHKTITQLSQAINRPSIPTAVGKCKISIEKNKKKIEKIYLFVFIY